MFIMKVGRKNLAWMNHATGRVRLNSIHYPFAFSWTSNKFYV